MVDDAFSVVSEDVPDLLPVFSDDSVVSEDVVQAAEVWDEIATVESVPVDLLSVPLDDLGMTDFLLLLIFCVLMIHTVLRLFLRKWGFPE